MFISLLPLLIQVITSNELYDLSHGYYPLITVYANTNTTKYNVTTSLDTSVNINTSKTVNESSPSSSLHNQNNNWDTKMSTSELGPPKNGILTNLQEHINYLSTADAAEIADFHIHDFSQEMIVEIFKGLPVDALYRVLSNISEDDLSLLIQSKLSYSQVNEILDRLTLDQKTTIENKFLSLITSP